MSADDELDDMELALQANDRAELGIAPLNAPTEPPGSVPIIDGDVQVGTMFLKRTTEGYEARVYRVPSGLAPGVAAGIPLENRALMWAAVYGVDRKLIRVLDEGER